MRHCRHTGHFSSWSDSPVAGSGGSSFCEVLAAISSVIEQVWLKANEEMNRTTFNELFVDCDVMVVIFKLTFLTDLLNNVFANNVIYIRQKP